MDTSYMAVWCDNLCWLWCHLIVLLLPCLMTFIVATGFGPTWDTVAQYVPKKRQYLSDWLKVNVHALWWLLCNLLNMAQLNMIAWGRTQVKTRQCTGCIFFKRRPPRLNYRLLCLYTLALQAEHENDAVPATKEAARFDTDSFAVTVDRGATATMSSFKQDPLQPVQATVHSFISASLKQVCKGTICWNIPDDDGNAHRVLIPDSYYVPQGRTRLLSPQHWAQVQKDYHPDPDGTWCGTCYNHMVLHWDQHAYKLTLPFHHYHGNTVTMHCNTGHSHYHAFCTEIGEGGTTEPPIFAQDAHLIPPDDQDDSEDKHENVVMGANPSTETSDKDQESRDHLGTAPRPVEFSLDGPNKPSHTIDEDEDKPPQDPTAKLPWWHHKAGHAPFKHLREMAKQGHLPKRLATCRMPMCTSCAHGKATKRPWQGKTSKQGTPQVPITAPGQCVSVDQLISHTPGVIAQLCRTPAHKRYQAATAFVDHYSRLSYVHLQQSTSAEETLQAKLAFERCAAQHGVVIKHYHVDNGIFADSKFTQAVEEAGQTLSFCGVNAHHANGVAERRIRELQDRARTVLIHANRRWPAAINAHLWPCALREANDRWNSMCNAHLGDTPISR